MVHQRSLAGQLPHPHVAVLGTGQEEAALTCEVHPGDPSVVGGDLADDVAPGQAEQSDVTAPVSGDENTLKLSATLD